MQTTAHARRPPLFTRHAVVAALILLPAVPLAGGSQSIPSETKYAIAYTGVAVRLLFWSLNQQAMAAPMRLGDGTGRTYVVHTRPGVPTSLGVELSESALRGLTSQTGVASPLVP